MTRNWPQFAGKREVLAGMFLLAMAICHVALAIRVLPLLQSGFQDFTIFYTAGTMVRSGHSAALYDIDAQYRAQLRFAPDVSIRKAALPYNHPPFEALLFAPLAYFGYWPAYAIWTALNLAMLAASLALLSKRFVEYARIPFPWLIGAAAGFYPVVIALVQGQDSILLLFLTILAMVAAARERDAEAGAILALALFKFHLIIPLVVLLAVRKPRVLAGFLPVAAALVALSAALVGWQGSLGYVRFVLHVEGHGAAGGISPSQMPSLHGLLACISGGHAEGLGGAGLVGGASLVVLAVGIRGVKMWGANVSRLFAVASVSALLLGYHTVQHDLSLLLPTAILFGSFVILLESPAPWNDGLLALLMFLTPAYVVFGLYWNRMGLFGIVLLWCLLRLANNDQREGLTA